MLNVKMNRVLGIIIPSFDSLAIVDIDISDGFEWPVDFNDYSTYSGFISQRQSKE
jgi:hypothetical protein